MLQKDTLSLSHSSQAATIMPSFHHGCSGRPRPLAQPLICLPKPVSSLSAQAAALRPLFCKNWLSHPPALASQAHALPAKAHSQQHPRPEAARVRLKGSKTEASLRWPGRRRRRAGPTGARRPPCELVALLACALQLAFCYIKEGRGRAGLAAFFAARRQLAQARACRTNTQVAKVC